MVEVVVLLGDGKKLVKDLGEDVPLAYGGKGGELGTVGRTVKLGRDGKRLLVRRVLGGTSERIDPMTLKLPRKVATHHSPLSLEIDMCVA